MIGVVLLLGITILLFTLLNFYVFQFSFNPSTPSANLFGTMDNNTINIEHNGGESLGGETDITITIGDDTNQIKAIDLLVDRNGDYKWNFGESVQFSLKGIDITDKYIQAIVVDPLTNSILLTVVLQQGLGS